MSIILEKDQKTYPSKPYVVVYNKENFYFGNLPNACNHINFLKSSKKDSNIIFSDKLSELEKKISNILLKR